MFLKDREIPEGDRVHLAQENSQKQYSDAWELELILVCSRVNFDYDNEL